MEPPETASFSSIRAQLDPCCDYVVLESEDRDNAVTDVRAALDALPLTAGDILEQRLCRDAPAGRLLLVVKLAQGCTDPVRARVLAEFLPPHMALHYYGRHRHGESRGDE